MPILTVLASQIATRTGDAEPEMPGDEMVERCFFNWTYVDNGRPTIDKTV